MLQLFLRRKQIRQSKKFIRLLSQSQLSTLKFWNLKSTMSIIVKRVTVVTIYFGRKSNRKWLFFSLQEAWKNLCVSLKGNLELSKKLLFSSNDLHVSISKYSNIREKGEVYERRRFDFCIYLRRTYFVIDLDAGQWKKVFHRTINVIFITWQILYL